MVIFDSTLVRESPGAADAADAIRQAAAGGLDAGLFTSQYVDAVCAREEHYPTGLATNAAIGVAIPHASPTSGEQPLSLSMTRFGAPVTFRAMGEPSTTVEVSLVFLMSVPGVDYVGMLSALAQAFQDDQAMRRLAVGDIDSNYLLLRGVLVSAGIPVERVRQHLAESGQGA